jgi:hypothetical protein
MRGQLTEALPQCCHGDVRPTQVNIDGRCPVKQVEDREVQHHHLRVLKLHEGRTSFLMRHLFNLEGRIDERCLRILQQLRYTSNNVGFPDEEPDVFDPTAELWQRDPHFRAGCTGVGGGQEGD